MALCRLGHFYLVLSSEASIWLEAQCFKNTISSFGLQPHLNENPVTFMQIDHKIISRVILPLLRIQEGQLSVTGKNVITIKCLLSTERTNPGE